MQRFCLVSVLMLSIFVIPQSVVHACTGTNALYNINWRLNQNEVVVTGRFVELDDIARNGIFQVNQYFVGSGAEYLALNLQDNDNYHRRHTMRRNYGCGYSELRPMSMNADYIFFLDQNINGTFSFINVSLHSYYEFTAEQRTQRMAINPPDVAMSEDIVEWNFDETVAHMVAQPDIEPIVPDVSQPYPNKAAILLTFGNVSQRDDITGHVLVPVDGSTPFHIAEADVPQYTRQPQQCEVPPCTIYSASGADQFNLYLVEPTGRPIVMGGHTDLYVYGQRIIASPTDDTVAVWQDGQIVIYYPSYPNRGFDIRVNELEMLREVHVHGSTLTYPAAWSPDGRYLAFSDDSGLYLWDVFTPFAHPERILEREGAFVPTIRYFSPMGRYATLSQGTLNFTYDLHSGTRFPDGLVSPDDRAMLAFDTTNPHIMDISIQLFAPLKQAENQMHYWRATQHHAQYEWISDTQYLYAACGRGWAEVDGPSLPWAEWCGLYQGGIHRYERDNLFLIRSEVESEYYRSLSYDFDLHTEELLLVINEERLFIEDVEIDLSTVLGEYGYIREATWLPSFFYYEAD